MKIFWLIVILIALVSGSIFAQTDVVNDLIGTWVGEANQQTPGGVIHFKMTLVFPPNLATVRTFTSSIVMTMPDGKVFDNNPINLVSLKFIGSVPFVIDDVFAEQFPIIFISGAEKTILIDDWMTVTSFKKIR